MKFAALLVILLAGIVLALTVLETPKAPENDVAAASTATDAFVGLELEAKAAIVIDMRTGEILYEKNADAQLPLASLTKVALVLAVADALPLDSIITIPYYASGTGESGHLNKGELWRVQDVIDFTLVASSNGGAEILSNAANSALHERFPESPAISATLWRMNDLAQDLGLHRTYFLNVSGLDLSTSLAGAYGSARDVANLYAYAASSDPSLFAATAKNDVLITEANGANTQSAVNTNNAQGAIVGLIMGKTGFTDLAGGNLAIVFDVGLAHPVVAIVLGSSEDGRFTDMRKLTERARRSITGAL